MKWLFRKSKETGQPPAFQERLAERFVGSLLRAQRSLADKLNQATAGWSGLRMRMALYVFCLLFGGISTIITVNAINAPAVGGKMAIPAPMVKMPPQVEMPDREDTRQAQLKELEVIQQRLDSLPADSVPPQLRAQFEELKKQILNP